MINMPNCRVQNTVSVLRECCEMLEYEEVGDLSESEQKAFTQLLRLCGKLARFYAPDPAPALPTKVCSSCKEAKPLDQYNTRNGGSAILSSCKTCRNAQRRSLRQRASDDLTAKVIAALRSAPLTASDLAKHVGSSVQAVGHVAAASDRIISVRDWRQTFVTYHLTDTQKPQKQKPGRPCLPPETIDPNVKTKTCVKCKKRLPETDFRFRFTDAHVRHNRCKHCMTLDDSRRGFKRAAPIADIMPLVFELLTQHGPMQSDSIIELAHKKWPELQLSYQRLYAAVVGWEHASRIERHRDRRGMGYVYRVVGDTRPIFFEKSAMDKEHPPGVERIVDDPEGDAWFANLKAEVAERRARRARMQW